MSGMEPTRATSMMSLHLSRVLDAVGVSERAVNKRRQAHFIAEKFANVCHDLDGLGCISYFFGSQGESSTTVGLSSDVDMLIHKNDAIAIQSMCEWKLGKINLLVLQGGDIPAGYCRLQLLSQLAPIPMILPPDEKFTLDDKGRVILNHVFPNIPKCTLNGPAATKTRNEATVDQDFVFAIKCNSELQQVEPLIRRMQNKQWPPHIMLKTATESGFFLVPVGYRLSATRNVEWRISPSFTERCLMFGMNITQMKCYVILKMIKKDLIISKIGESFTSFHLKNALFHCVENTPEELWRQENLIACIHLCLKYLLTCVQKRSCPNYLIPEENLFSGRITEDKIPHLQNLLHDLIESNGFYLFQITCDEVGELLNQCLNHPFRSEPDVLILRKAIMLGYLELFRISFFQDLFENSLKHASVQRVQERLIKLRTFQNCSDSDIKSVATSYLQFLYSTYGSILASLCIRGGIGISQGALSYLERGCCHDLKAGRLKKASALYCCGQYTEAASVLEDLDSRYDFRCLQSVCNCHTHNERPLNLKQKFIQHVFNDEIKSKNSKLTACHVAFTSSEIHCCPLALRFDMFRGIRVKTALRRPDEDSWMDMAAVDSVIFLYFLMYLAYGSLGNHRLRRNALNNLYSLLSPNEEVLFIIHYDTAMNLLGQCFEIEGMLGHALLCFKLSLQWKLRHNSASWLVALLIYKHLCRQLLSLQESISHILKY